MNLGENSNFFRESFRGFNKDDVAEYIAKLSKDYTANEEKYKEHIAKLNAELKAKTDSIGVLEADIERLTYESYESAEPAPQSNLAEETERKYKAEIESLYSELSEKEGTIAALQTRLESGVEAAAYESREELDKYKEAMNGMAKEIEEFKEKCEELAHEASALRKTEPDINRDAMNQLSLQLAANESERLYLVSLLKKFIFALDIDSARGKEIGNISNISDIAPKSLIAGEIESGLTALIRYKETSEELRAENAALREELGQKQAALSNEEQMYRSIMTKLGETVYSANKLAEDSVAKARDEADSIIELAQEEADDIIDRANAKSDVLAAEDKKTMSEIKAKYDFIKKEHESMYQKYKELTDNYELKLLEIESTINVIYDSINNA